MNIRTGLIKFIREGCNQLLVDSAFPFCYDSFKFQIEENAMNRSKVRLHLFVFVLLAALLFTSAVSAAPKDGPVVSLSTAQTDFASEQDVLITVTFSNPQSHTVRVLKWFTAVDGMEEPFLAVMRDGEPVAYLGAHYKRPAVKGRDYISLRAGESISHTVNLADVYDLSQSGQYQVFYAAASFQLFDERGNSFKNRDSLTSEAIAIHVEGRAAKGRPTPPPTPVPGGNAFNACSVDQQTILTTARQNATAYANESEAYLNRNNSGTLRYLEWFGLYSASRYSKVNDNFSEIAAAFREAGILFDCKCKQNYYAYVYPNQPYNIYLCKVFWQAPPTGTDSRAGTLIHEMSHFDVVAGTDDVVYGQSGARTLADSDPDRAITNADSHEYFAENTPLLP
jgi:peptidyl-Lys metalloendopeptidase